MTQVTRYGLGLAAALSALAACGDSERDRASERTQVGLGDTSTLMPVDSAFTNPSPATPPAPATKPATKPAPKPNAKPGHHAPAGSGEQATEATPTTDDHGALGRTPDEAPVTRDTAPDVGQPDAFYNGPEAPASPSAPGPAPTPAPTPAPGSGPAPAPAPSPPATTVDTAPLPPASGGASTTDTASTPGCGAGTTDTSATANCGGAGTTDTASFRPARGATTIRARPHAGTTDTMVPPPSPPHRYVRPGITQPARVQPGVYR